MTTTVYDCFAVQCSTGSTATTGHQDGTAEGERRRDVALALLTVRRAALVRRGCRLFVHELLRTGTATADDIAAGVPTAPGIDRRLMGVVPLTLAKAGVAELAGYQRSNRPERHASVLGIWRLADRAAALRWLAENPPLAELRTARQMELDFANDEPATVAAAAGSF